MDITELTLSNAVCAPGIPKQAELSADSPEAKKIQFAKDFESVVINKLFDEMKNTIGDWGFEKDGASEQVQGLFWMNLAIDVADKGGFGMWKDIYNSLSSSEPVNSESTIVLDSKV
ncbi:MAG: hypothetical protein K8R02_04560 [Anaerohalosphaeraceae bacterium]|nr:hypothetical protein [Anaerohalosphaeraceae bacterium]